MSRRYLPDLHTHKTNTVSTKYKMVTVLENPVLCNFDFQSSNLNNLLVSK